jgi:hypothetical protein
MALPGITGSTVPSVDDCSRTALPPLLRGGWNASEWMAGFRRNHRLASVGMPGWFPSDYALHGFALRSYPPAGTGGRLYRHELVPGFAQPGMGSERLQVHHELARIERVDRLKLDRREAPIFRTLQREVRREGSDLRRAR